MNFASVLIWAGTIEVIVSAGIGLASVICYHAWTHGEWRKTSTGRHIMAYMAAITATLLVSVVRLAGGNRLDVQWFAVVRLTVFTLVPIVMAWRFWIIYRAFKSGPSLNGNEQ